MEHKEPALVTQFEIARFFGISWRRSRQLLENAGVRILEAGPRRWYCHRGAWLQFLERNQLSVPA